MPLTGKNLIAGEWSGDTSQGFVAFDAVNNQPMTTTFADATSKEIEQAISSANRAFSSYSQLSANKRASFLRMTFV